MTNRWNNVEKEEKEEKDRKMKNDEETKTREISTFESRYFKKIWQDDKKIKNRTKRGLKDEKMTRWWKDDVRHNIDN